MPSSRRSASVSPSTASPSRLRLRRAPLSRIFGDRGAELLGTGVDDEVADHLAQHAPRDGHDRGGQDGRHRPADGHGRAQVPGQEAGHERSDAPQIGCRGREALGAHDPVDEPDRERQSVRVLEHAGQTRGGGIDVGLGGFVGPALRRARSPRRRSRRAWRDAVPSLSFGIGVLPGSLVIPFMKSDHLR